MAKKRRTESKSRIKPKSLLSRFELKTIQCVQTETRLNVRVGPLPKNSKVNVKSDCAASRDERTIKCNAYCELLSFYEGEDSGQPAVIIRCQYQVIYRCKIKSFPSKKTVDEHKSLISTTAMFQAWPFVRQYVHWMTTQMGLPSLTLPMMFVDDESGAIATIGGSRFGPSDQQQD